MPQSYSSSQDLSLQDAPPLYGQDAPPHQDAPPLHGQDDSPSHGQDTLPHGQDSLPIDPSLQDYDDDSIT